MLFLHRIFLYTCHDERAIIVTIILINVPCKKSCDRRTPKKVKFGDVEEKEIERNVTKVAKSTVPIEPSFMRASRKRTRVDEKSESVKKEPAKKETAKKESRGKVGPNPVTKPKPFSFCGRKPNVSVKDASENLSKFKASCSQLAAQPAQLATQSAKRVRLFVKIWL